MNKRLTFQQGISDVLPTIFGYLGIGLAFGIVGHAAGMSNLLVFLLSALVYGGSVQFIIVSMLAASGPFFPIILSVFLVNSRIILMGLSVAGHFQKESLVKNIWIGSLLSDETFALGMAKSHITGGKLSIPWYSAANICAYLSWSLASIVGVLLGGLIPNPAELGLDFALTAMFVGLLYLQIITDKGIPFKLQGLMVLITLVLMFVGTIFIPASLLVLVVTLVGSGLGVWLKYAAFQL